MFSVGMSRIKNKFSSGVTFRVRLRLGVRLYFDRDILTGDILIEHLFGAVSVP